MARVYPSEHPLGSAAAKVERAKMHIDDLTRSIKNTTEPDITIVRQGHLKGHGPVAPDGSIVDEIIIEPRDPTTWSTMIGDVVGNLRSALDHVAWALTQRHIQEASITLTEVQERRITFPLGNDPKGFSVNYGIPPTAKSVIESFQPYNSPKWPELELLGVLDKLSRIDKHRLIIAIERLVRLRITSETTQWVHASLDKPHRELIFSPPVEEDDFKPQSTFDIVMETTAGGPLFSALELGRIHDFIRDEVLPAFAGFFEEPDAGGGQESPPDSASTPKG